MTEALQIFTLESRELLDQMEGALLAGDPGAEGINAVFRAAHTIKGSAGLFGLEHIVAFTHVVEGVLDRARDGRLAFDTGLTALMLACGDHIRLLVDAVYAGRMEEDTELAAFGAPLVERLGHYLAAPDGERRPASPAAAQPGAGSAGHWHISLRFGAEVLRNGMDPMSFLRYLGTMGRLVRVATLDGAVPALADIDPEACYLGFEIVFESAAERAAIEGAFDFVREDCAVHVIAPRSAPAEYARLIETYPEQAVLLGELFALGAGLDAGAAARRGRTWCAQPRPPLRRRPTTGPSPNRAASATVAAPRTLRYASTPTSSTT
ncbi:MAG: Hpt domain-containing protein [Janthinobacterium lividum]